MLVLGLCVAHDAGVALVDDGHVVGLVQRERWDRVKRSALITPDFLEYALDQLGVIWAEIDTVAISTCQSWPFLFLEPDRFRFAYAPEVAEELGLDAEQCTRVRRAQAAYDRHRVLAAERAERIADGLYGEYFSVDQRPLAKPGYSEVNVEWPVYSSLWTDRVHERREVRDAVASNLSRSTSGVGYATVRVTFDGVDKPGILVPHHLAHAAYGFFQSGEERAAIATLDNGDVMGGTGGYYGGILARGEGNRLTVLDFRFAFEGHLYQRIGEFCGLGHGGAAGKLMGLAPYGTPEYFHPALLGDAYRIFGLEYVSGKKDGRGHVMAPMIHLAREAYERDGRMLDSILDGIDPESHGAKDVTGQKTRLAASAQALMEEQTLLTLAGLHAGFAQGGAPIDAVVLSGGVALNCPANSRAARETAFERVRVAPAVDDSGLPLGAAMAVVHDLFDRPRRDVDPDSAEIAYLGRAFDGASVDRAIAAAGDAVRVEPVDDPAAAAAEDLAADNVVAWFEGRSEIGPRALGRRSILADARAEANWRRVNRLKKREEWRPFAPAVLTEKAADWFDGPLPSPHMLFTARVKGPDLPAITHVDGSARVQTVGRECGGYRRVLEAFEARTGVPVLMNTSFNGPGEPIVETPEQAIAFLTSSEIDAVYLEGRKLVRADRRD
jgi:carbamoyltransferase